MSCSNNSSPCCNDTQLVVENFCADFNTLDTPTQTLWIEKSAQQSVITVTLSDESTNSATVTVTLSSGTPTTYTLNRGESRTDSFTNALSLSVAATSATNKAQGRACITVYRKFTE